MHSLKQHPYCLMPPNYNRQLSANVGYNNLPCDITLVLIMTGTS